MNSRDASVRWQVCPCSLVLHEVDARNTSLETLVVVEQVMKSARGPAVDTLSASCMSLPGTAELKISGLMFFSTKRDIVTASVTYCSSYGWVPTLWSSTSPFILCGMLSLGHGIVVKIQSARMATIVTCRNASTSS